MEQQSNQNSPSHYLLTALGIHPRSTIYTLEDKTAKAYYSPVALLQLLQPETRPGTVLCLLADKARAKFWDGFAEAVRPLTAPELLGGTEAGSSTITTEGDGAS